MKITILAISDSDKHFASAISEYTKRLGKSIDIQHIKPIKHGTRDQIISKETDLILSKITKRKQKWDNIVLLSKGGKAWTTEQFVSKFKPWKTYTIIIWWPYGLDEKTLQSMIDYRISLWMHTMPHGLAQLVLLEQVYRINTIHEGKMYHY